MVRKMTPRTYSQGELRAAGASDLFIDYYFEAPPQARARRKVDRSDDIMGIGEDPARGGLFFERLWKGDTSKAWLWADNRNREILKRLASERTVRDPEFDMF